jgi:hypothetical protein
MDKPHATLRPGVNAALVLLWGALATVLFLTCGKPYPVLVTGIGALLGLVGGIMQTLSFRQAKESFLDAATMLEVRAKLKATPWGSRYLHFLWFGHGLLVILSVAFSTDPVLAVATGYFSLMFVRELITLKPTLELNRLQLGKPGNAEQGPAS